jgi:hypothetical protein
VQFRSAGCKIAIESSQPHDKICRLTARKFKRLSF